MTKKISMRSLPADCRAAVFYTSQWNLFDKQRSVQYW